MVRVKMSNVGPHDRAPPKDLTTRYGAPFHLRTDGEVEIYEKLHVFMVTIPHYLDWDLLKDLKIVARVTKYLKVLGLENYAKTVDFSGYHPLCLEFLSTMYVIEAKKTIGVRKNGRDFQINLTKMKDVFGFETSGERKRPDSFNVVAGWHELTGFDNWDALGRPNGYIDDPALVIVHKFIAYNVSVKEQGNKVNANEVYLLHCALKGKKVCITNFIWAAMRQMQTRARMHPSLAAIVTGLAHSAGILSATTGDQAGFDEILPYSIDYNELKGAGIIIDRYTLRASGN